ncbi:hypothetical protein FRC05_008048 [Tulasnella sp. 425]|nr:hypothetical protein FRC05_008048 [Tulasnella sp. 425]
MAQVDAQNGLLNLSSVAAFFSGIAATTIQYIIDKIDTRLQQVVVTLWIASIIFGIGAAVNSQLAYQWRAAMYRSPQSAIPGFASFWLTRTPLVFLALSIIAFSAGLLCYAYSSFQGTLVTACTTVFTCLASLAPFSVAVWLATERLVFAKAEGRRTSQNLTREWRGVSRRRTWLIWVPKAPLSWLKKVAIRSIEVLRKFGDSLSSTIERPTARRGSSSMGRNLFDMEEYAAGLPTPTTATKAEMMRWFSNVSDPKPIRAQSPPPVHQAFETHEISSSPVQERAPWLGPGHHTTPPQDSAQDPPPPPTSPTPKMTFEDDARKVRSLERMKPTPKLQTKIGLENHARERSLTLPSSPDGQADSNERYAPRPARLAGLIPELKALKPMQEISERGGLVRHLQFSPDGKWLATCGHGTKALIWKVEETVSLHRFILHPGTELLSQVAWSPDGKYLLTRGFRHAKVWVAETGVLMKSIRCISKIEDVTWMPSGDSFTCVEGSVVHIRDLKGKINADHPFKRLDIHDVAVTHDEQRMVLVASLQSSGDDLIIVYHLGNEKVECQVSVLKNIRNVTISSDTSNGYLALISYEGTATPELWRISVVNTEDHQEARLQLLQTYMPTAVMEFAGPSYLGGTHDQFVIEGNIHIWDRETGLLLHSLQGANIIGNTPEDLTAVGWNNCATGRYMFASGTSGGTIRIWTAEEAPPDSRLPSRTGSPTPSGPV